MNRSLFIAVSIIALLGTIELPAQLRDIRLAPELRDYSLPAEAQIQSVASIGTRHLVAWGTTAFDADSTVINVLWMRLLDGSRPLLENRIVHSPQARPYGFVLVVASAQQFLVFWNDRRADAPGTYFRRFDFNGNAQGSEERINIGPVRNDTTNKPKSDNSVLTFTSLPGWTFVQVESARPFVVRDNAVVDTRPLAIDHMQGAYYLAEDTSVVVLKGKAVQFYRNLFDTTVVRTVAVPQLDSALANSEVVMRDSVGRYGIMYAVVSDPKTYECNYWEVDVTTDTLAQPIFLFKDYIPVFREFNNHIADLPYGCHGAERHRGCDNAYGIIVSYRAWSSRECHGTPSPWEVPNHQQYTGISTNNVFTRPWGSDFNTKLAALSCTLLALPTLTRSSHDTVTTITLSFQADTTGVISGVAFRYLPIPRTLPDLFLDSTSLVINWFHNGNRKDPSVGLWNVISLLQPISPLKELQFGKAPPNPQIDGSEGHGGWVGINYELKRGIVEGMGIVFAYSVQHRVDSVAYGSCNPGIPVEVTYLEVQRLTAKGWRVVQADPGYGRTGFFGGNGYPAPPRDIAGYSYDNYYRDLYTYVFSGSLASWMDIRPARISPTYQRTSSDRWLRWFISEDSLHWTFEIVDSSHNVYAAHDLQLASNPRSIFITQNFPDKSIAVVWGSNRGVLGSFMNQSLDVLAENIQISETRDSVSYPSAAYRNDTLFVAWEDYRNGGIADVYGTAFTGAPKASSVEIARAPQQKAQIMQIWPNPAREVIQISYPAASEGTTIEIYDALGQLRLKQDLPAGSIGTGVAAEKLSPGMYMVVLNTKSGSIATHCIVAR